MGFCSPLQIHEEDFVHTAENMKGYLSRYPELHILVVTECNSWAGENYNLYKLSTDKWFRQSYLESIQWQSTSRLTLIGVTNKVLLMKTGICSTETFKCFECKKGWHLHSISMKIGSKKQMYITRASPASDLQHG